jgi:hypothetical protein
MADMNPNPWDRIRSILLQRCIKCGRPYAGSSDAADWAYQAFLMKIVYGIKCPDCQSPEERAEVVIREVGGAKYKFDGLLLVEHPKPGDGDDGSQTKAS